jgi:hypothetical protein
MTNPVGVLAVRIWRDDSGEICTRVMAKLDVLDTGAPEVSFHSSAGEINSVVASWFRRYAALPTATRATR